MVKQKKAKADYSGLGNEQGNLENGGDQVYLDDRGMLIKFSDDTDEGMFCFDDSKQELALYCNKPSCLHNDQECVSNQLLRYLVSYSGIVFGASDSTVNEIWTCSDNTMKCFYRSKDDIYGLWGYQGYLYYMTDFGIYRLLIQNPFEKEKVLDRPVLCITPKGKEKRVASKIATGMAVALVANLFYGALYCFCQFLFLGMTFQDWKQPLFFVDGCQICASGATIGGFIAKQLLVSVLISILTAFPTMLFSKLFRKSMLSLTVTCVIFGTALLPDLFNDVVFSGKYTIHMNDWYFLSEPEFYRLLRTEKLFNPISLLRFQYYARQPRYLQLSGYQYPAVIFPVLVAALEKKGK